jgi:hypothetical protein
MALINTTTTGVLGSTFFGDGSGDLTIQQNGVTLNKITSQPAFSAYRETSQQSFTTATWSKVFYNAESYDTANCYDSTTNYRFTPNVAGYYSVNVSVNYSMGTASTAGIAVYKNGSAFKYGPVLQATIASSTTLIGNYTVYLNGSTDYIEGYTYSNGTSPLVVNSIEQSYFEACLIKAA